MTKLAVTTLLSCLALTAACKKKDAAVDDKAAAKPAEVAAPAAKAAPAAPVPTAAPVDTKLAGVGITVTLPADAEIHESKMDAGGTQATITYPGIRNFFVSTVGDDGYSWERTLQLAEAKEWKIKEQGADGTWKLKWTKADVADPSKLVYGVEVRAKVGTTLYDCGSAGLTEAEAEALLKICATMK